MRPPSGEASSAQIDEAERRLEAARRRGAASAEQRVAAEIEALEADLERERAEAAAALEQLRLAHEEELQREREAKERAIADGRGAAWPRSKPRPRPPSSGSSAAETARRRGGAGDRRRAGAGPRGGGGLAARAARRDPPRGRAAIAANAEFDVAVVGGGAAGLWTALRAAEQGGRVCLVSRTPLSQSASFWAQGGLAAALEPDDSPERHAADTIAAGRGLCRPSAVQVLVEEAPAAVRDLRSRGVVFDLDHEGGWRSASRAATPAAASSTPAAADRPRDHLEAGRDGRRRAADRGARADLGDGAVERRRALPRGAHRRRPIAAAATVLATGGAAALWRRTTNPRGAIGAGPTLASAAGADLADLEFCQFHPTALALPGTRFDGLLITEAIRGEGATLLDAAGERFTDELAPRDAVTAAILDQMEADGAAAVELDLRGIDPARFPNVFASLREAGPRPARANRSRSPPPPTT